MSGVLAISASPRGFAFVLFQKKDTPFDWGIKEIRGPLKNPRCLLAIKKLVVRYRPERIVLEDLSAKGSRRGPRIRALHKMIERLAQSERVRVVRYSRAEIRSAFGAENARTRPEIAQAVAKRIPAFAPKLPPLRKIWMSEDPRQSLFDAAALGVTWYGRTPNVRRDT